MSYLVVHASSIDLIHWRPFRHVRLRPFASVEAVAAVVDQFVRLNLAKSQLFSNCIKVVKSPLLFKV